MLSAVRPPSVRALADKIATRSPRKDRGACFPSNWRSSVQHTVSWNRVWLQIRLNVDRSTQMQIDLPAIVRLSRFDPCLLQRWRSASWRMAWPFSSVALLASSRSHLLDDHFQRPTYFCFDRAGVGFIVEPELQLEGRVSAFIRLPVRSDRFQTSLGKELLG